MTPEGMEQKEFEDLSALLDGELSPQRAAEVEAMLRGDPQRQAVWEDLRAVDAALDCYTVPAADPELVERILREAHSLVRRRPLIVRIGRWAAPLAAAAAAAVITVSVLNQPNDTKPSWDQNLTNADKLVVTLPALFEDYETIENLPTLKAIDELDRR